MGQYAVQRVNAYLSTRTSYNALNFRSFNVSPNVLTFFLRSQGSTRKKIAAASGASLEYVGNLGIMAGDRDERARCWDYVKWLMKKLKGTLPEHVSYKDRTDVTVFRASSGKEMRDILGKGGENLRDIEMQHGVYVINIPADKQDEELLLVYSHSPRARGEAKRALNNLVNRRRETRPNRCFDFSVGRCARGDSCKWPHVMNNNDGGHSGGGPSRRRDKKRGRDSKPYAKPTRRRDEKPPVDQCGDLALDEAVMQKKEIKVVQTTSTHD